MFSDSQTFRENYQERIRRDFGRSLEEVSNRERYQALARMLMEEIGVRWCATNRHYRETGCKQAYYFSMEFLPGKSLYMHLINMGIYETCREGLRELGIGIGDLAAAEPDAGLGNGGLGRLASCFLDSLAFRSMPVHGCGIYYQYGLFEQRIIDGVQVELPDNWLQEGSPWSIRRSGRAAEVRFYGHVTVDRSGETLVFSHHDYETVRAVPYDMPVPGYRNPTVNTMRLWRAEMEPGQDRRILGERPDPRRLLEYKRSMESISEFLYPDDTHPEGKELRLKQQYFLVSAGLQGILHAFRRTGRPWEELPDRVAVHINDTHPVLAIPELMRILMDEDGLRWETAWEITGQTISYTNHTTLAEALESWPQDMVRRLLPRIYMIIEEIDNRFSGQVAQQSADDPDREGRVRILADGQIRMANLAVAGSHSVNGVARLHTEILRTGLMRDLSSLFPERFNNKTNGISHRRFLLSANPALARHITGAIGDGWITEPERLRELVPFARDGGFCRELQRIRQQNKKDLSAFIRERTGIPVDPDSLFDVQIKRLHAYKRQVLNVLRILYLYDRLREEPNLDIPPRTFVFGAKAAPSYRFAKSVICLINATARMVNRDPRTRERIQVVFLENYRVSLAERIIPAADLSEQISMAGKEASGTGNMKFMLNGALTIGTLDGANVEIREAVGEENIFIFGLKADEARERLLSGHYDARAVCQADERLRRVVDRYLTVELAREHGEIGDIVHALYEENDQYLVFADFAAYLAAQERVDALYPDRDAWMGKSVLNIAHAGRFSADRTVAEYADQIWGVSGCRPDGAGCQDADGTD